MDVTPQLLKEVEFREKFRGYDPDEVDDFLERVGIAFGQLQEKLRDGTDQIEAANARAARAEARARDSSDADDTLRRTLVLAQRTADAAIKEAEENAASIIAAAEAQARQQYSAAEDRASQLQASAESDTRRVREEADADARRMRDDAERERAEKIAAARAEADELVRNARDEAGRLVTEARHSAERMIADAEVAALRNVEEKRAKLTSEVADLERRRNALAHDLNALETHTSLQRDRMNTVLQQLRSIVEEPAGLGELPLPELTSLSVADAAAAHGLGRSTPAPSAPSAPSAPDAPTAGPSAGTAPTRGPAVAPAAGAPTARVSNDEGGGPDEPPKPATANGTSGTTESVGAEPAAAQTDRDQAPIVDLIESEERDRAAGATTAKRSSSERVLTDVPAAAAAPAARSAPRPLPPVQAPTGDRSSSGLGTPMPASEHATGAPPWMGMAPPPPPPPPPSTPVDSKEANVVPGVVPPPPPAPAAKEGAGARRAAESEAEAESEADRTSNSGDSFLDELRRAVGEDTEDGRGEDPAIRFFEDRDPTDPALRFFENGDESRSRFRRR